MAQKVFSVEMDGLTVDQVRAIHYAEALSYAIGAYGFSVTVRELQDEIDADREWIKGESPLFITPQYDCDLLQAENPAELTMVFQKWAAAKRGVKVVQTHFFTLQHTLPSAVVPAGLPAGAVPVQTLFTMYVIYYSLIQCPKAKTLDERELDFYLNKPQGEIEAEIEFLKSLLGEHMNDEALFALARSMEVAWVEHRDPRITRKNCIQAIRKHNGWI